MLGFAFPGSDVSRLNTGAPTYVEKEGNRRWKAGAKGRADFACVCNRNPWGPQSEEDLGGR